MRAMSRIETVPLIHPDLPGQVYPAPKPAVRALARTGWRPAAPPPEPDPDQSESTTQAPATAGAFALPDDQPPRRRRAAPRGDE